MAHTHYIILLSNPYLNRPIPIIGSVYMHNLVSCLYRAAGILMHWIVLDPPRRPHDLPAARRPARIRNGLLCRAHNASVSVRSSRTHHICLYTKMDKKKIHLYDQHESLPFSDKCE